MGVQARVLLRESRPLTHYDDETVRILPQTWYLHGANGHPTCHRALSYDNVARVARQNRPVSVIRRGHVPWSVSMASLCRGHASVPQRVGRASPVPSVSVLPGR